MVTKRFSFTLLCLLLVVLTFANNKNFESDVTMVSYEQSWLDSEGTLALKNNSGVDINNIAFRIQYLDMSGKQLDYADFVRDVNIAPGMTKKINIPSYERSRNYHYYKTKDGYGHPAFKIAFEVKDYNFEDTGENVGLDDSYGTNTTGSYDWFTTNFILFSIVLIIFLLGVYVGLYILVAVMAQKRNRSVPAWIFLSLIATPILIIIILLCIGDNNDYVCESPDTEQ